MSDKVFNTPEEMLTAQDMGETAVETLNTDGRSSPPVRERRRKRKRFEPDATVPSPCIGVCIIERPSRLCRGCKRSIDEIRDWMITDADGKQAILADIPNREF
ncbi:MAG: DUF1289 domain-containing protein [Alphaproteobacteria bacterium]